MQIILIRHAQPEWSVDGIRVGTDPELTTLGHHQAERLAEAYADLVPTHVAVSPLVRTRQTAAPLLARLGFAVDDHIEPWLAEIRDPDWKGRPDAEAEAVFAAADRVHATERWNGLPGGEPPREFVARVSAGATTWLAGHGVRAATGELPTWEVDDLDQRLVIVAHGGTNGVLVCQLLGIPPTPWEWQRFSHLHTGVTRFECFPVGDHVAFTLAQLSNVEHLARHERTG